MARYIFSRKKNRKKNCLIFFRSVIFRLESSHSILGPFKSKLTNEPCRAKMSRLITRSTTTNPRLYWHLLCKHNANSIYVHQYYHIIFKVALWSRPRRWFPTLKSQWSATVPEQIEDQIHGEGSLGRLSCESYLNVNWISHAFDE